MWRLLSFGILLSLVGGHVLQAVNPEDMQFQARRVKNTAVYHTGESMVVAGLTGAILMPVAKLLPGQEISPRLVSQVGQPRFTIRLARKRSRFRQGEAIVLELGYGAKPRARIRRPWLHHDRPGLAVDKLHLEPQAGVADPLRDFLGSVGGWSGPPPRPRLFVEERDGWTRAEINEWFRFDQPGTYRLSVIAHPVRRERPYYDYWRGVPELTSNTIEFEIVPAGPAWQAATLRKALKLISEKPKYERRSEGCWLLRFLTTRAAVDAMIGHFSGENGCGRNAEYGIFAFPDREYVVRRLEESLVEPSMPVDADYLRSLGALSVYLRHPELLPLQFDAYIGTSENPMGGPLALASWYLVEAEENRYAQQLMRAVNNKTPAARAVCLKTFFETWTIGQPRELEADDPKLLGELGKQMVEFFEHSPASEQLDLLYPPWPDFVRAPALPVLRRLYANPPASVSPSGNSNEFVAVTLERFYDLAPTEGRQLILTEMKRLHPRLRIERFDPNRPLPDKELPEMDGTWAKNLESPLAWDPTIVSLVGRYATPAICGPVLAAGRDRFMSLPCEPQADFLAYALKCNAAIGAELLEKALAMKQGGCNGRTIADVASRQMAPELERVATKHIDDPNPYVAAAAADMLRDKGSPAVEQLLWDRLEKWHATWAAHAEELQDNRKDAGETELEAALVWALGSGTAWFAGRDKLTRLSNLCLSPQGCQWVLAMVGQFCDPPIIKLIVQPGGMQSAYINQYSLTSLNSLEQKLSQFPKGTEFKWTVAGPADAAAPIVAELRAFLNGRGMTLR
jgi:hypothetical protein